MTCQERPPSREDRRLGCRRDAEATMQKLTELGVEWKVEAFDPMDPDSALGQF